MHPTDSRGSRSPEKIPKPWNPCITPSQTVRNSYGRVPHQGHDFPIQPLNDSYVEPSTTRTESVGYSTHGVTKLLCCSFSQASTLHPIYPEIPAKYGKPLLQAPYSACFYIRPFPFTWICVSGLIPTSSVLSEV